jgi:hypothetical protein
MIESRRFTTEPPRAHPLVRALYRRMGELGDTYEQLGAASRVKKSCSKAWRTSNAPGTDSVQAALNAVGLQALPVPRIEILPEPLAAELRAIGERHGIPNPIAELAIVAAARLNDEGK